MLIGGGGDHRQKTSWPEVVGMGFLWAAMKIRIDRSDVDVEVHKVGDSVEPGYNNKRVRMFIYNGVVAQTPVIG
nr:unnamed protein product [Digitaria exilis]